MDISNVDNANNNINNSNNNNGGSSNTEADNDGKEENTQQTDAAPEATMSSAETTEIKRKWFKRPWGIAALVVVSLLIAVGVLGTILVGEETGEDTEEVAVSQAQTEAEVSSTTTSTSTSTTRQTTSTTTPGFNAPDLSGYPPEVRAELWIRILADFDDDFLLGAPALAKITVELADTRQGEFRPDFPESCWWLENAALLLNFFEDVSEVPVNATGPEKDASELIQDMVRDMRIQLEIPRGFSCL